MLALLVLNFITCLSRLYFFILFYVGFHETFQGFTLHDETPKDQEFLRFTIEGTSVLFKRWPTSDNHASFQLWSNVRGDVLDYKDLKWISLLSPVDVSLDVVNDQTTQVDTTAAFHRRILRFIFNLFI